MQLTGNLRRLARFVAWQPHLYSAGPGKRTAGSANRFCPLFRAVFAFAALVCIPENRRISRRFGLSKTPENAGGRKPFRAFIMPGGVYVGAGRFSCRGNHFPEQKSLLAIFACITKRRERKLERLTGGAESAGLCGFAKGETVTAGLAFPSSSLAKILFGQAEPADKPPVFSINGRYNGKCGGQGKGLWMQAPLPGKLRGESPAALRPHTTPPRISTNAPQGCKLLPPAFYRTAAALSGAMWKRKRLSGVGIQKTHA